MSLKASYSSLIQPACSATRPQWAISVKIVHQLIAKIVVCGLDILWRLQNIKKITARRRLLFLYEF